MRPVGGLLNLSVLLNYRNLLRQTLWFLNILLLIKYSIEMFSLMYVMYCPLSFFMTQVTRDGVDCGLAGRTRLVSVPFL